MVIGLVCQTSCCMHHMMEQGCVSLQELQSGEATDGRVIRTDVSVT